MPLPDHLRTLALILATLGLTWACSESDPEDSDDTGSAVPDDTGEGLTEEELCWEAYDRAYTDCVASLEECACEYEEHWNMDEYESDYLKWCYGGGYLACYDIECRETCFDGVDEGACCLAAMDYFRDERPPTQDGW